MIENYRQVIESVSVRWDEVDMSAALALAGLPQSVVSDASGRPAPPLLGFLGDAAAATYQGTEINARDHGDRLSSSARSSGRPLAQIVTHPRFCSKLMRTLQRLASAERAGFAGKIGD